jgi:hypothetical protein
MSLRPCGCGGSRGIAPSESGGARNITNEGEPSVDPIVPFCDLCDRRIDLAGVGEMSVGEDGSRRDMCAICRSEGKTL